jgi:PAS domain S-box-containing protein
LGTTSIDSDSLDLAKRAASVRRLVEANIIGIVIGELEGQILEANEAFLRIVGYDREDLVSGRLRWTDFMVQWLDRDLRELVAELQRTGSLQPFEWEYSRKDGSRLPVLIGVASFGESQAVGFVLDLTERKRAERALREGEELWRATFEANPTMYFMVDRAGFVSSVNAFGAEKLQYNANELIGQSWLNISYGPDREAARQHAEDCFRELGHMMHWELRKVCKDGTVMWLRETANAVFVKDRPILFITCEDITERRRVEQALRQSEAYLAEAQRLAHMGSWAYNHVTGKQTYSAETFRLFGLDPRRGHLPQLDEIRQIVHPEDRERAFAELAEVFREKAEYVQDYRVVLPDGTVRHLHSIGHPVLDQAGELLEYVGTVMDVTERRRAERRLRMQHRVTRILAEAASVEEAMPEILQTVCECMEWVLGALWSIDREAGVLRCAKLWRGPSVDVAQFEAATRTCTFRSGSGLPGRVWASGAPAIIPDVVCDPEFDRAEIAARAGLHSAFAFPILLGCEVLGVLDFISRDVWQPEPKPLEIMTMLGSQIGQFIERKRAENALQLAQSELAHVTRVMTIGELTASIAHEVNQPLGAIVASAASCARWLAAEPPNMEKALRALDRIVNDGNRASAIIRRIRTLMKRQAPRKGWLDINETILEVIALAQYQLRRNNILLETRLTKDLPLVQGDRVQLQQLLLNLIVNAVEAMSGINERRRELTILSAADQYQAVCVEVRDSGTGLDPEQATHLFEPFYTTKAEGLGIGLWISRSILEAHGGHLSASGNTPHGAVFRFTLPVEEPIP